MFTDIMFSSDCTNIMTNGKEKLVVKKVSSDDMGFCSGGEDSSFLDNEPDDVRSPTDASEDSIDVKISPISIRNKRKSSEPRRASNPTSSGPLKKRVCRELQTGAPFRPWSPPGYFRPPSPVKREEEVPRVPVHPGVGTLSTVETERMILKASEHFPGLKNNSGVQQSKREQRNYKNMTRERRIEANARERTRVHTISAAFDTLRKAIPSYSHNQKLSKLSVLRIACSYIMTLSSIVSDDEEGTSRNVEMVSKTIQREGKLRKKKDDED